MGRPPQLVQGQGQGLRRPPTPEPGLLHCLWSTGYWRFYPLFFIYSIGGWVAGWVHSAGGRAGQYSEGGCIWGSSSCPCLPTPHRPPCCVFLPSLLLLLSALPSASSIAPQRPIARVRRAPCTQPTPPPNPKPQPYTPSGQIRPSSSLPVVPTLLPNQPTSQPTNQPTNQPTIHSGAAILFPIVPTLLTNAFASLDAGYPMDCTAHVQPTLPPECANAPSQVVAWSAWTSFLQSTVVAFLFSPGR